MVVFNIQTSEEYQKVISSSNITVALFSAEWAEQCKQVLDVFTELTKQNEYKNLQFINVPAEELSEISLKHQIDSVPTVIFFSNSTATDRIDGINIASLLTKCKALAGIQENAKEKLNERLKALINKADLMIFMKGDRNTPKCGFSKTLIAIVNETQVPYETFDILTDEAVRQGLKTYSDWPTYPQVYVKGELIGGLDIIKEMLAAGELNDALKG